MSNPNAPWSSGGGGDQPPPGVPSGSPAPSEPFEQPELVNEPVQRTNVPIRIMIVALLALLVTVGGVAYLTTRTTEQGSPTQTPIAPDPTGPPVLPLRAGEYAREPGDATAPPDFGVDRSIQTTYANYLRNNEPVLIAVAARPVEDSKALFDQIKIRAQREVGDGWCGRDGSGLDVCILQRGRTAVLTFGLRDQTPEEIMQATQLILTDTA